MSVHTRTRRIKPIARPVKKIHRKTEEKSIPWRDLFKKEHEKFTEPGYTLKAYRCKHELTQKEFGKIIGVSQNHLSEMENGKRPIGKEMAKRFAKFFKIDYRNFL
ncbi:MAG TPA: helix-turn-helix transcriptional regulator [Rhabdochlamydiaceae bacterium]|nr:helix-turn-helix transcriptional regulator [Rhabdochlamydiaceae bacterium]